MAGAIIIACGIGILLLVFVGYVMVSGTLTSADSIASAQKEMTALKEKQLNTNIDVTYANKDPGYILNFDVKNTGNEKINIDQLGVVVVPSGSGNPIYFKKGDGTGNTWELGDIYADDDWAPEIINLDQWDPGEYLYCGIDTTVYESGVIYVFTANGVTDWRTVVW